MNRQSERTEKPRPQKRCGPASSEARPAGPNEARSESLQELDVERVAVDVRGVIAADGVGPVEPDPGVPHLQDVGVELRPQPYAVEAVVRRRAGQPVPHMRPVEPRTRQEAPGRLPEEGLVELGRVLNAALARRLRRLE